MKKLLFTLFILLCFTSTIVEAKPTNNAHRGSYPHHHHSSSSSSNYVIKTDYIRDEHNFANCDEHSVIKETTVNYYSNGNKRAYSYYTILNNDGTVLESNCTDVKHTIFEDTHYIIYKKGKYYRIIDGDGKVVSIRNYTKLQELIPNRFLARIDKKYGIIDLKENVIVPLKYKSFEQVQKDLFLTNLNGYYGLMNSSNQIFIENDYDKITPIYDTYVLKRMGKYGLADYNANLIYEPKYDKIKSLGEYILIEKDNKIGVLNSKGKAITEIKYKKVKLDRNTLKGKNAHNVWKEIDINI